MYHSRVFNSLWNLGPADLQDSSSLIPLDPKQGPARASSPHSQRNSETSNRNTASQHFSLWKALTPQESNHNSPTDCPARVHSRVDDHSTHLHCSSGLDPLWAVSARAMQGQGSDPSSTAAEPCYHTLGSFNLPTLTSTHFLCIWSLACLAMSSPGYKPGVKSHPTPEWI